MPLPRPVAIGKALLNAQQQPPFIFDTSLATFTAGMAKRLPSSGPFAVAVVAQGARDNTSTVDSVTYAASQVTGGFYSSFDGHQGTISFFVTPEWAGNDGLERVLWH